MGEVHAEPDATAEIAWDDAGVPHITAQSDLAGFRAFGWAQMEAHADMILKLYGGARGRGAEYWGESQIAADVTTRTLGLPGLAQEWLRALTPEERARLDAFVGGMNAYAKAHPEAISPENQVVLPIRNTDTLAYIEQFINVVFTGGTTLAAAQSAPLQAGKLTSADPAKAHDAGSNGYAFAPSRSADGNPMLLINPHLPWRAPFAWFESQLKLPSFDIYGVANVGMPTINIGFNEAGGWTHTVNTVDSADLYALTLRGESYLFDGEYRPLCSRTETYRVKLPDGTLETRKLVIRSSVHGPIIRQEGDKALAVRLAALRIFGLLGQYWSMASARDLGQFESAMKRLQIPGFNTIYANRDGHIYYYYGARIPDRKTGDAVFWSGIVPGDRPEFVWDRFLPYEGSPRLVDPASGFIQNANDGPWYASYPSPFDTAAFAPNIAPLPRLYWRPQHSLRQVMKRDRISYDDLLVMTEANRLEMADHILDSLLAAIDRETDPLTAEAARVLRAWDRTAGRDSKGSILFLRWSDALRSRYGDAAYASAWSADRPLSTPSGLADPSAAVQLLREAAQYLEARHGRVDLSYGDVVRLRLGGQDIPASGGPQIAGSFRAVTTKTEPDGSETVVGGNTFVAAVSFGARLKARGLLPYGNSSQPGGALIGDQQVTFANEQLRPLHYYDADVSRHLTRTETLTGGN